MLSKPILISMKKNFVSIIILNWNGLSHLSDCLESLKKQTFKNFECILVDNGSTDGSVEFLRSEHKWLKLLVLEKNLGFAEGNLVGYQASSGDYIVTLNNDTIVEPNWLEELVKTADSNPSAGMVGCRICSNQNHNLIDSLGVKICIDGMSRGAFRGKLFSRLESKPSEILLPSACAALYKREMLEQTGFFDKSFFAYCEDTDLGLRGRLAGWKSVLAVNSVVYHKYSATAGSFSPFKLYLVERNHYWSNFKNLPVLLLLLLPITTLMRYLVQLLAVMKSHGSGQAFRTSNKPFKCLFAVAKGLYHGIILSDSILRKRSVNKSKQKVSDAAFIRLLFSQRLSFFELLDLK